MKRSELFAVVALIAGTALIAWGLYSPLVTIPGIGTVRFPERDLGGPALARSIIVLLILATLFVPFRERARRLGLLCAGSGIGLAIASFLAIYRDAMEKLNQFNDMNGKPSADVALIFANMKPGPGMYALAAGFILCLLGTLHGVWRK